eukprot:569046_1
MSVQKNALSGEAKEEEENEEITHHRRANAKPRSTMFTRVTRLLDGYPTRNVYLIGGIVIGALGAAAAGLFIYRTWWREAALIDQNNQLKSQNLSCQTDINQLQNRIKVNARDLKGR